MVKYLCCTFLEFYFDIVLWNMLTMKDYRTKTLIRALLVHYRLFYCLSAYFLKSPYIENRCIVHRYCHNITFYCGCTKHSQVIFLFYSYYACYDKRSYCKHLPLPISWFSMMLSSNTSTRFNSIMGPVHYPKCLWLIVH